MDQQNIDEYVHRAGELHKLAQQMQERLSELFYKEFLELPHQDYHKAL